VAQGEVERGEITPGIKNAPKRNGEKPQKSRRRFGERELLPFKGVHGLKGKGERSEVRHPRRQASRNSEPSRGALHSDRSEVRALLREKRETKR